MGKKIFTILRRKFLFIRFILDMFQVDTNCREFKLALERLNTTLSMENIEALEKVGNFLISQPKHMLWVLKRTVSMRRFF